jgi:post-segregation antitoxin (ccd killing protein)
MTKNRTSITLDDKLWQDAKIETIRRKIGVNQLVEIAIRKELKK